MTKPKVTIFVPSFNHAKFVPVLIESIYQQPFKDFELIVIDDGSIDGSPEILKALREKHRFHLVLKENEGLCKTLNQGIALARGEYFTGIASDDFIPENRLSEQVAYLDAHRDVDVVAGSEIIVDVHGEKRGKKSPKLKGFISFNEMVKINRVLAATVMMRTSVFERFGKYDETHVFEDYGMWLKILKNGGTIFNTDNVWAYYRISNVDLEKKINWYYRGAVQALNEFRHMPSVQKQLEKHKLVYLLKLALLLGLKGMNDYKDVLQSLGTKERLFVSFFGALPEVLRDQALKFLQLKT